MFSSQFHYCRMQMKMIKAKWLVSAMLPKTESSHRHARKNCKIDLIVHHLCSLSPSAHCLFCHLDRFTLSTCLLYNTGFSQRKYWFTMMRVLKLLPSFLTLLLKEWREVWSSDVNAALFNIYKFTSIQAKRKKKVFPLFYPPPSALYYISDWVFLRGGNFWVNKRL